MNSFVYNLATKAYLDSTHCIIVKKPFRLDIAFMHYILSLLKYAISISVSANIVQMNLCIQISAITFMPYFISGIDTTFNIFMSTSSYFSG